MVDDSWGSRIVVYSITDSLHSEHLRGHSRSLCPALVRWVTQSLPPRNWLPADRVDSMQLRVAGIKGMQHFYSQSHFVPRLIRRIARSDRIYIALRLCTNVQLYSLILAIPIALVSCIFDNTDNDCIIVSIVSYHESFHHWRCRPTYIRHAWV